jgi:hypothetical protein
MFYRHFLGANDLKETINSKSSQFVRRAAVAIAATATLAAPAAYSRTSNNLIVVPPTDLPELARQTGEAMLLHDTNDGRTLLYIEQNHGAQLAMFDVSDPGHIKGKGSVPIDAPGPFDFVSSLGERAEVVRFRQHQGSAVLDLHKVDAPTLMKVQGLTLQGTTMSLGDDGFTVTSSADSNPRSDRDVQVVDSGSFGDSNHVFEVRGVREEVTKNDTGTTFLLTQSGLYIVRRPIVEKTNELRERERMLRYVGG